MKNFKELNKKERLAYIGILAMYPFIVFFYQMKKYIKVFTSKSKQITASVLTVCLICTMIPVMSLTAFAAPSGSGASAGDPYVVTTGEDFKTALESTANTTNYIRLDACVSLSGYIAVSNSVVVDLNGYTINTASSDTYISGSQTMTFKNGYIDAGATAFFNSKTNNTGPDYVLENLVITNTGDICVYVGYAGTLNATNCSFTTAAATPIDANRNGAVFTLTDCYLQGNSYAYKQSDNPLTIDGSSITGNASSATYDGGFANNISRRHAPVSGTLCTVCDDVAPHNHDDVTFEPWTATDTLPTTSGNYYLVNDVTLEDYVWLQENVDITLCLNDKVVTAKEYETCSIFVLQGASLTIYDCGDADRSYTENEFDYYWELDEIFDTTEKEKLTTGGVITGMANSAIMNSGTLTINGGNIVGNRYNSYSGGGIQNNGRLTINGGHILGNYTSNFYGGGISNSGTFTMTGGEIAYNVSGGAGAGIHNWEGTVAISGGIIHNNNIDDNISNDAGELTDLLADGYAFYDKDGNEIAPENLSTAEYLEVKKAIPPHTHSWATEWTVNSTHHWHECTADGCEVTENSQKNGYAAHYYTGDYTCDCGLHTHDNITFDKEWSVKTYYIPAGNYYLTEDFTAKDFFAVESGTEVNLCLNGHTLDLARRYIEVEVGGTLNIYDCGTDGIITTNFSNNINGTIENYGTVNLYGGKIENTSTYMYAIAFLNKESAVFNMYGGTLTTALDEYNDSNYVLENYGEINISGGKITGKTNGIFNNSIANISGGEITGLYGIRNNGNGTLKITGGTITGSSYGVYNYGTGTVDVSGGKVKATDSDSYGYGIYNYGTGTIKVLDGEINGINYGIYNSDGTIEISGGTITGTNEIGIYNDWGYIYLSGNPEISGSDDIQLYLGMLYAHANGDINDAYEGNLITIEILNSFTDGVVVYEVNDNNAEKFSLAESCTQTLVRVGDNLIVDGTAPTGEINIKNNPWKAFFYNASFGMFCKDYVEITITGADAESGVAKIEYYLSDTAISDTEIKNISAWVEYDGGNKPGLTANEKKFVYAKITNNAGNVTYLSVDGGVVVFNDTTVTTGEYEYTLTTKTDIVTNIKPGDNEIAYIDICEPGGNAGNMLDYFVNNEGYVVFKGESLENFTKDWYAGDYTVTIVYNALGETYVDGTSLGDKITDTVITLTVHKADGKAQILSDISKTYDGVKADAPNYNKLGTGEVIIEYKVKDADDSTYEATAPKDAGDYTVRVTVASDNTYKQAFATADFTIAKANFTTVVEQEGSLIYNGDEQSAAVKANESGVNAGVTYKYGLTENECDSATVPAFKNADTYTVYYTASCPNFNDCKGSFTVTVEKKELTVTAKNGSVDYGDAPRGFGVIYDGFVAGDTEDVLDGTLSYSFNYEQFYDVGYDYTITPQGLSSDNYKFKYISGTLAVLELVVEIEWGSLSDSELVYNGQNKILTATVKNKVGTDDITVVLEYNGDQTQVTEEGFYAKVVGLNGEKRLNYYVPSNIMSPVYNITKADPTVTWPSALVGNAGDKLSTVALESGFSWDNADTAIAYSDNNYGMTYTPADTDNYNILKKDIKVNGLDVTVPTGEITLKDNKWNVFFSDIAFGLFFKETQSITIAAADTESGVKEIAYYLATEELSADDVKALENSKWTVYTDAFNVEPDNKYVVYARITDLAGNIVYINSNGIVLDSVKPVIAGVEDGSDVYGDATFTVDETYLDTVTLDGQPIEVVDGKYTVAADNKEHTIVVTDKTGNQVTYKLTVYKNYKVSFVVDGKEISSSEVGYGKDATLPEIPKKDGYTAAWDVDGKNITADTVITAVYEKIPESPKTGDNTNALVFAQFMLICSLAIFGIAKTKKRKAK